MITHRMLSRALPSIALAASGCATASGPAPDRDPAAPAFVNQHVSHPEDLRAIEAVLAAYPRAVTESDRAAFEALLLSPAIVFTSTRGPTTRADDPGAALAGYAGFRKAVFESGRRYRQHFYNVRIQQDGDLAQASLDFVTQDADSGGGGFGWKCLLLLKVQGTWKIASEIYTVRDLPASPDPVE